MNTTMKLITFLARKLVSIAIIILLIVLATFISYDMANVYIVINDALSQRAETIIHQENPANLERFFTLKYLNSDPMFSRNQFDDYVIEDYEYVLKIKKMWIWPWQSSTEVVVEEYIPEASWKFSITDEMRERLIEAQYPSSQDNDDEDGVNRNNESLELDIPSPQWQNGEKIVEFRKIDGQWKINGIVFVKSINPDQNKKNKSAD